MSHLQYCPCQVYCREGCTVLNDKDNTAVLSLSGLLYRGVYSTVLVRAREGSTVLSLSRINSSEVTGIPLSSASVPCFVCGSDPPVPICAVTGLPAKYAPPPPPPPSRLPSNPRGSFFPSSHAKTQSCLCLLLAKSMSCKGIVTCASLAHVVGLLGMSITDTLSCLAHDMSCICISTSRFNLGSSQEPCTEYASFLSVFFFHFSFPFPYRYKDPLTGLPYLDAEALRVIRSRYAADAPERKQVHCRYTSVYRYTVLAPVCASML